MAGIYNTEAREYGQSGAVYTANTSAVTGDFWKIYALEATVISSLSAQNWDGTLTSIPLPANGEIVGDFRGYTLASGKVIAYKK